MHLAAGKYFALTKYFLTLFLVENKYIPARILRPYRDFLRCLREVMKNWIYLSTESLRREWTG